MAEGSGVAERQANGFPGPWNGPAVAPMTRGRSLKIPYGERRGELVDVNDVESGLACACMCPVCGARLVARKGSKVAHHFGHFQDTGCNPETVAHALGKRLLMERLSQALAEARPIPIRWPCGLCQDTHEGDVGRRAATVQAEMALGECRPDISLIGRTGRPVALLEVVVSHPPDDNVRNFCAQRSIPLFEFHISSGDILRALQNRDELEATSSDYCLRPKCYNCRAPMHRRFVAVVDAECWRCDGPMKVAMLDNGGLIRGPDCFTEPELAKAQEFGAVIRENYSKTLEDRYMANTCKRCKAFVGKFHLHDYWHLLEEARLAPLGFGCPDCMAEEPAI